MARQGGSPVVNLKKNFNRQPTYLSVFPMYGLWDGKTTFKSQKQADFRNFKLDPKPQPKHGKAPDEDENVDKTHFRKVYFEKVYMDELLKSKNMMINKK